MSSLLDAEPVSRDTTRGTRPVDRGLERRLSDTELFFSTTGPAFR